jgi:aldehyde dehydrogenase (NAD+)/aldehyde dehydrogenase
MIKNTLSIVLHEPIGVVGEIILGISNANASLESCSSFSNRLYLQLLNQLSKPNKCYYVNGIDRWYFPAGVLNIVTGFGEAGQALATSKRC